ncbi:MAG: DUF2306 domain-containing protein [Anaerolineales bacterium]
MNTIISYFHISNAIFALIFGVCIFLMHKGSRIHKIFGYGYVISMATLNISAMLIYRLTGHFGPFHGAAIASFITLVAGFIPAWRRKPSIQWLEYHYQFMCWSYAGLVAAGASEVMTRVPASPFWPAVMATSVFIFLVSGYLISQYNAKDLVKK